MFRQGCLSSLLMASLLATGCTTVPHLDPSRTGQVKPGITTMKEVTALFGPAKLTHKWEGNTLFFFRSKDSTTVNTDALILQGEYTTFSVLFGPDGVAKQTHSHTVKLRGRHSPVHGVVIGENLVEDNVRRLKRGTTTKTEVEAMFGEPQIIELTVGGHLLHRWTSGKLARNNIRVRYKLLTARYEANDMLADFSFEDDQIPLSGSDSAEESDTQVVD